MNNQPTLTPETATTDLVLKFVGGRKDGQEVSINTPRCMLGVKGRNAETGQPTTGQCALFRGSAGVAVQARGAEVLVNDQPVVTKWLQLGDRLQLSPTHAVEVVQLGSIVGEIDPSIIPPRIVRVPLVTEPIASAENSYNTAFAAVEEARRAEPGKSTVSDSAQDDQVTGTGSVADGRLDFVPTRPVNASESDGRITAIESSIDQLRGSSEAVNGRFDRLENSLSSLTDQLEKLTNNTFTAPAVESPQPASNATATVAPAEPPRDSSQDAYESLTSGPSETPEVPETTETTGEAPESGSEDYHNTIASLFSDLASDPVAEETIESPLVAPTLEAESSVSKEAEAQTLADILRDDVADPLEVTSAGALVEDAFPSAETTPHDAEQPLETEPAAETELAAEPELTEIAEEVSTDVTSVDSPEAQEPSPAESVADIFARLQLENTDSFDEPDTIPTQANDTGAATTSFADIEASISAAFAEPVEASVPVTDVEPSLTAPEETEETVFSPESFAAEQSPLAGLSATDAEPAADAIVDAEPLVEAEHVVEAEATAGETGGAHDEDSVDDYMSMLLTRMRGGSGEPEATVVSKSNDAVTPPEEPSNVGISDTETASSTATLTEEEFKPRRKATTIKSFDKMRELANSTTRSAIQRSINTQKQQRSKSLVLQSLSLGSLALAGVMAYSKAMLPAFAFGLIFAVAFGYLIYDTIKPVANLATGTVAKKKVVAATDEVKPEEAE